MPRAAFAAHPLITEDTGTQGRGGWQLEVNAEKTRDDVDGVRVRGFLPAATLSHGVAENVDLQATVLWLRREAAGQVDEGLLDTALDVKWRFYENGRLSLGLKPGITLATGDDTRKLGAGRATWGSLLILSYQLERWEFHADAGYRRHRNTAGERTSLKHWSGAAWFHATEKLKLIFDLSRTTDPDPASDATVRQAVYGFIYSVTADFDLDAGVRRGNVPAIDRALLFGATLRW